MDTTSLRRTYYLFPCLLAAACHSPTALQEGSALNSKMLQPGRMLVIMPERAWAAEKCDSRSLPFIRSNGTDIVPAIVKPGTSLLYHFSYMSCVPSQPGYILGKFRTTVSFESKNVSIRSDDTYPIETGGWAINTEILVPSDAPSGMYSIEGDLIGKGVRIQDRLNFVVE